MLGICKYNSTDLKKTVLLMNLTHCGYCYSLINIYAFVLK